MTRFMGILCGMIFLMTDLKAHEGHDHVPKIVQAPHDGILQEAQDLAVKALQEGSTIKLIPLVMDDSKKFKVANLGEIKLEVMFEAPKKRAKSLSVVKLSDAFSVQVDTKGLHRFKLNVTVNYRGRRETFVFQIEPEQN